MVLEGMKVSHAAIYSRLFTLALAVLSDMQLVDHSAEGVQLFEMSPSCRARVLLQPFTRWDAAHLLKVSNTGWGGHEYQHAFFPGYPLFVRKIAQSLSDIGAMYLCQEELLVLVAVVISNVMFVVAACCLERLGQHVLREKSLARAAAILFCASPASPFFSTAYTESTFAAATFGGFLLLEIGYPWISCFVLGLATFCRANGTIHTLTVACVLADRHNFFKVIRRRDSRHRHLIMAALARTVLQCTVIVAPYVVWQLAGYHRVCHGALIRARGRTSEDMNAETPTRIAYSSVTTLPLSWCEKPWPDLYSHVQRQYWGVSFLGYFEWRQLPNFILAAPAILMCTGSTVLSGADVLSGEAFGAKRMTFQRAHSYMLEWAALSAGILFFGNVQTLTRLAGAACPAFYWSMACMADCDGNHGNLYKKHGETFSRWPKRWVRPLVYAYAGCFAVLGTILHSNFYPWT